MSEFLDIVRTRRSANKFLPGFDIPQADFDAIFRELSLAPSAFNLQHAHYHVVRDRETIGKLHEAAFSQHKVVSASAVVVVTGNTLAWQEAGKIYEGTRALGILDDAAFTFLTDMIRQLYEGWGETFQHDEAIRNASLSAMLFMLLAKNLGWDSCPMNYFKKDEVATILGLNDQEVPVLMIPVGKSDPDSHRLRGYRKPASEFVHYIG